MALEDRLFFIASTSVPCLFSAVFAFSLLSLGVVSSFRGLLWHFVIEGLPSSSGPPF